MRKGKSGQFSRAADRWVHGLTIVAMAGMILLGASALAGIPLIIVAELLGQPWLGNWANIATLTGLVTLPYLLTHRATVDALRHFLDPKVRED
jgi:hypothetical protein